MKRMLLSAFCFSLLPLLGCDRRIGEPASAPAEKADRIHRFAPDMAISDSAVGKRAREKGITKTQSLADYQEVAETEKARREIVNNPRKYGWNGK